MSQLGYSTSARGHDSVQERITIHVNEQERSTAQQRLGQTQVHSDICEFSLVVDEYLAWFVAASIFSADCHRQVLVPVVIPVAECGCVSIADTVYLRCCEQVIRMVDEGAAVVDKEGCSTRAKMAWNKNVAISVSINVGTCSAVGFACIAQSRLLGHVGKLGGGIR